MKKVKNQSKFQRLMKGYHIDKTRRHSKHCYAFPIDIFGTKYSRIDQVKVLEGNL